MAGAAAIGGGVLNYLQNKEERELQEEQYRLNLKAEYSNQLTRLEELKGQKADTELAISQETSNIGSNYEVLQRWQAYADQTTNQAMSEGKSSYSQLASAYADAQANIGDTGRLGGSASRIAGQARENLADSSGSSLKFNTQKGSFGTALQQANHDLISQRKTTINAISSSQSAISTYQESLKSLTSTIDKQNQIISDIRSEL